MNRLIIAYIIGSIFGIINELIISKCHHHCLKKYDMGCLLSTTILNLYGWVTVFITLFLDKMIKYNFSKLSIIILLIITVVVFECAGGKLSKKINGYQTWKYKEIFIPFCDGYCSIVSTIYFTVLLIIFINYIYPKI